MNLVLQKHSTGCGIACAAMIAGVSYDEALAAFRFGPRRRRYSTRSRDIRSALRRLGVAAHRDRLTPVDGIDHLPATPCLLKTRLDGRRQGNWHWCAWDGRQVLDPLAGSPEEPEEIWVISYMAFGRAP